MKDIIGTVLSVAKSLFGLKASLANARAKRKKTVAKFLARIAETIEDTSAALKHGNYPHGKCQELLQHSQSMESAIGDLVGEKKATELGNHLKEVWEIELLHHELRGKPEAERNRKLEVLDQAAGLFRATAAFVKVSP